MYIHALTHGCIYLYIMYNNLNPCRLKILKLQSSDHFPIKDSLILYSKAFQRMIVYTNYTNSHTIDRRKSTPPGMYKTL